MKTVSIIAFVGFSVAAGAAFAHASGPSDEFARNAFRQILSQADTDKDGTLSQAECKGMYRDAAMAEKNCTFWDANHDGAITEDEYASKAMGMGKKR